VIYVAVGERWDFKALMKIGVPVCNRHIYEDNIWKLFRCTVEQRLGGLACLAPRSCESVARNQGTRERKKAKKRFRLIDPIRF